MVETLREAARLFSARGARFLGAAVAFYALLSAAPLLLVLVHLAGAVFGRARAEDALFAGLATWIGEPGVATVRAMTDRADHAFASSGLVGVALTLYGSTRLFRALRRALNQLWGVDLEAVEAKRSRTEKYAVRYGVAILLTALSAALLAALVLLKSATAMLTTLAPARPPPGLLWAVDVFVSVGIAFALFFAVFRALPEVKVTSGEAARSAAVSTALFALGSELVTIYLQHKDVGDLYAGASALVVVVLWVYYSAQVFFFGAAIGAVLAAPPAPTVESTGRRVA